MKKSGDAEKSSPFDTRFFRRVNGCCDLLAFASLNCKVDIVCARRLLQRVKLRNRFEVGIGKERHPAKSGHCLDQNFLPLAVKLVREDVDARCITVWPGLEATSPNPIISPVIARIGIVFVACCAARIVAYPRRLRWHRPVG